MNQTIKLKNILPLFLAIIFMVGCKKSEKETESERILNAIEKTNIATNTYKWIVILPGLGCGGCIQEGELFMKEYINNKEILFVLTKIESLKILRKKIGVKINDHSNIFIDKEAIFSLATDNGIYPCIVKLKDGNIESHEFQSPKNTSAFEKLKARI